MIHKNPKTDFCQEEFMPEIHGSAFIHPMACVIGHVSVGKNVMISPFASIRGDEGHPIVIGDDSNVQDAAVIHALETEHEGELIEENLVLVAGKKIAVHVGERVSLAHQSHIHGPAIIEDDTFIGMRSLLFRAGIGRGCVIEPGCTIIGVSISEGRYVPSGSVIKDQKLADKLPEITEDYNYKNLNRNVVRVNIELAKGYAGIDI